MVAKIKTNPEPGAAGRQAVADPTVLVLGMGATGVSCARFFAGRGIIAEFADSRPRPPGLQTIRELMPDARLHTGSRLDELGPSIRRVVVSPGVAMDSEVLAKARARGIEIVSDIDLFVTECRAPIIAVTGSNGKSTVTSMVASMLSSAGWAAAAGANLGVPALDLLGADKDIYVLELSSFQLERSRVVPCEVAVLLNLAPDHLDRHGYMSVYRAAKGRIYNGCRRAIVNRDSPELISLVPPDVPVTGFTLGEPTPGEFGIRENEGVWYLACGEALLLPVAEMPVAGRHNLANALAALALGSALDGDLFGLAAGLKHYRGMPHRMQAVSGAGGATWIDDSKATNVAAAVMSIRSVPDPLILIAGGDGKGAEFGELATALRGRDCTSILIGRDRERIAQALHGACEVRLAADMRDAVRCALELCEPGYTVLLAPACASQDMFESFAHRGAAFAAAVEAATE